MPSHPDMPPPAPRIPKPIAQKQQKTAEPAATAAPSAPKQPQAQAQQKVTLQVKSQPSAAIEPAKPIAYVYSEQYEKICSMLPSNKNRSKLVHALVRTYDHKLQHLALQQQRHVRPLEYITPEIASIDDIAAFHDRRYLEFIDKIDVSGRKLLKSLQAQQHQQQKQKSAKPPPSKRRRVYLEESDSDESESDDDDSDEEDDDSEEESDEEDEDDLKEEYGLVEDCEPFTGISSYIRMCAAGSIAAAKAINSRGFDIAINLDGGRHHALKSKAMGFCYVNDVVLAILELQKNPKHKRILCVDIDVHHGNGQEAAFLFSNRVFTLSFHQYGPGLFPADSGSIEDIGKGNGTNYNVNVPLKQGIDDNMYVNLFGSVLFKAVQRFKPNAIVLVCGVDGLAGDPLGSFNLTTQAYERCCLLAMSAAASASAATAQCPLLILGGGGYNLAQSAATLASIVGSLQLNKPLVGKSSTRDFSNCVSLPPSIPLESHLPSYDVSAFAEYGFKRECAQKQLIKNDNDALYIQQMQAQIFSMMDKIKVSQGIERQLSFHTSHEQTQ